MIRFLIALLVIWVILAILGFLIEGLFWLAVLGLVLFVATAAWGWFKRKTRDAA